MTRLSAKIPPGMTSLGRILVVDDEAPVREVLEEYLASEGYVVEAVSSGEEAVVMVTANEDASVARETLRVGAFDYIAKPFDFAYLERAVTAGLLHGGAEPSVTAPADETWAAMALAAFRAARAMPAPARASTGERLETAALFAARHRSTQPLDDVALILRLATELGDLEGRAAKPVQDAITAARKSLASRS